MKRILFIGMIGALLGVAGERKQLPGQAGNDDVDLEGSVILTHDEITEAIGSDIGEGYVVVRMKVIPKGATPLRVGPDDFTIISRKDGQKSQALAPTEIAGKGAMVVKHGTADGKKSELGRGRNGQLGSNPGTIQRDVIRERKIDDNAKESPALGALTAKVLPDKETKTPMEGLLYFSISTTKLKPKDVALVYNGAAGKLIMEFQPIKK